MKKALLNCTTGAEELVDMTPEEEAALAAQWSAAAPRESFHARDLIALFTPMDYGAIQAAITTSPALALLHARLLAQADVPIRFDGATFTQAWPVLASVIGQGRADEILNQLKGQ